AAPAPPVGVSTAAPPAVLVPPRPASTVRAGVLPNPVPPPAVAGSTGDREEQLVSDEDWEQIEKAIAQARDELKRAKAQFKSQKPQQQLERIHSDEFRQALERAKVEAEKARTAVQSAEFHADVLKGAAAGIREAQKAADDAQLALQK